MHKKGLSFTILILALSGSVFAQDSQDPVRNTKSYYFTKSGYVTELRDSAYFTRIMTPDPSNSKLYIVEDSYSDGKLRLKGKSLVPGPYFRGQGRFERYYPNGNLQETVTYENGTPTGQYTLQYNDGKLWELANYSNGKLSGERMTYYPNGNKRLTANYDNGVLLSSSQFFPNGKLYYSAVSDTAKKLEIIGDAYDLAGTQTAKNGNGIWVDYADTFKRVFRKGPIINGLKDGEWKVN